MSKEDLSKDTDNLTHENDAHTLRFTKDQAQKIRKESQRICPKQTESSDDSLLSDDVLRDAGYFDEEPDFMGSRVEKHQKSRTPFKDLKEKVVVFQDRMTQRFFKHETGQEEVKTVEELSDEVQEQTQHFQNPIITDEAMDSILHSDDLTIQHQTNEQLEEATQEDSDQFVKGAAWMTIGNIVSRILGALYIVPWAAWLGAEYTQANTLFSIGYKPYSLFLAIATAGFPSAIAKQMAYYHSLKEYKVADRLFKYSLIIMGITGLTSAGLLYAMAPQLGIHSATNNPAGAIMVIRSLVPALLILPIMSLLRGYFQGFNDMMPTAVSQIIEQVARIVYLLASTYAIMQVYSGNVTQAVVHKTFAAFIGALLSLVYLLVVYFKRLPRVKELIKTSRNRVSINFSESLRIMAVDSIPFIILGAGIIIAQMIDAYTFRQILQATSFLRLREISELYGAMSLDVDKLVMIIISLAVAISSSVIPAITGLYGRGKRYETRTLFERVVLLFSFVMFPAAFGLAAISDNMYYLFYPAGHELGPSLLVLASLSSIVLGAYTILSTVLQSMDFRQEAVKYLGIGLLVKCLLQFPLLAYLQTHGAILSTLLGFLVSSILMWRKLRKVLELTLYNLYTPLRDIIVASLAMGTGTYYLNLLLNTLIEATGRGMTFVKVIVSVSFAVIIYGGLMGVFGHWHILLGDRFKNLQEKMRFK